MTRLVVLLLMVVSVSACSRIAGTFDRIGIGRGGANQQTVVDGVRYKARLKADNEDRRMITITVTPVATNPQAALEAGRFEATKYCLRTYGGSETMWTYGPETPVENLVITDDTITLTGRCSKR
jgi:hypothetical protein